MSGKQATVIVEYHKQIGKHYCPMRFESSFRFEPEALQSIYAQTRSAWENYESKVDDCKTKLSEKRWISCSMLRSERENEPVAPKNKIPIFRR